MPGFSAATTRSSKARCLTCSSSNRSTPSQMFGRSNPRTITRGSCIPRRSMISARTGGAAVAVRASTVGWPSISITPPSLRYSGRKSCPHSLTQCASSTTISAGRAACKWSSTAALLNCSGARKRNWRRFPAIPSSVARRSVAERVELSSAAFPAPFFLDRMHLVALEGDQWRDDDRRAGQEERRDLIDSGFARPGRHDGERVAPIEDGAHRHLLTGAEVAIAEFVPRNAANLRRGGLLYRHR